MDNANTNESNENVNENDWVLINGTGQQVQNHEIILLPEKDSANKSRIEILNSCIGVLCENTDSDDTSNDVSVITESDTDTPNQDFLTHQDENKIYESENMVDKIFCQGQQLQNDITKSNAYVFSKNFFSTLLDYKICRPNCIKDKVISQLCGPPNNEVFNMVRYILFGCMIGIFLSHFFFITFWPTNDRNLNMNGIKELQTECHNIINTFKEVNATLNEIKAHILIANKLNKDHTRQLKNINYSNKMNNKPIMESFNNGPHLLDHLQESLNVLSLLSNDMIYDDSKNLLKNEINKTLDVVNNIKIFYETLVLLNDSTQSMNISAIVQFLQNAISKIHDTSRSLLTDLVKKISNIMINVHNKYSKMRYKLSEKLCYLKNVLPSDSKFLEQLTEKSQFLNNYDRYCFSKNISIKLNGKTNKEENTRTNNIKSQPEKTDDSILHTKLEKEDTQTIDNEIYCNKVINDHLQSTQTNKCTDETLNNNLDETTNKQNTKVTSDYGKITVDKTKVKGPKTNNHFKSNDSTGKVFNTDKPIKEKYTSPKIKTRIHVSKLDKGHYKHSSKDNPADQDYHQIKSADWLFERSNERQKLRQASNVYSTKMPKTSKYEVNFDEAINNMIQTFGKSIDKAMRFFKRKVEDVLRHRDSLKKK